MVKDGLKEKEGWLEAQVSATRRAFGMKRRAFALFANHTLGTLTFIVTVTWKTRSIDSLSLVRRLMRGVRVDLKGAQGAARVRVSDAPMDSPLRP